MKKDRSTTPLLVLIFVFGLGLLLYPSISNYWNSMHQSRAITGYSEAVSSISAEEYTACLEAARTYNRRIPLRMNAFTPTDEEAAEYATLLDFSGDGVMGYIEIPAIDVHLPVYHGTSDAVLQVAVGHLDWTALPVGGESTHCVLSGHRGLPSAKLFTRLDKLVVGDRFMIRVLNEVLTYEVDQVLIVEPQDVKDLKIVEGQDLCTLVTCTPYGINSHRLLVRGHRVANEAVAATVNITAEAVQVEPTLVSAVVGLPLLTLMVLGSLLFGGKKKR